MSGALSGILLNRSGADARDRVVAVGPGDQIVGETHPGADGRWSMAPSGVASQIVAQEAGERVGAAATPVASAARITLPNLVASQFTFDPPIEGADFAVDPVELIGFPDDLLWTLRTHQNRVIDLHVGQYPVRPSPLRLELQPGRYRLTGGRLALHPVTSPSQAPMTVAAVEDVATGHRVTAANGEVIMEVFGPASYRVTFAPGP